MYFLGLAHHGRYPMFLHLDCWIWFDTKIFLSHVFIHGLLGMVLQTFLLPHVYHMLSLVSCQVLPFTCSSHVFLHELLGMVLHKNCFRHMLSHFCSDSFRVHLFTCLSQVLLHKLLCFPTTSFLTHHMFLPMYRWVSICTRRLCITCYSSWIVRRRFFAREFCITCI